MPNNIIKITDFDIKTSDTFFFDNNIWMYIFCPLANFQKDKKQRVYSKFLEQILNRKLHIYTNSLVLSEFANRYLRLDFDIERKKPENAGVFNDFKKDYVGTAKYTSTVNEVKKYLSQIVLICQKSSDEFNSINIEDVFVLFKTIGFNDSYYLHLASKKNWIIVSDDKDFSNNQIPDKNLKILVA